MLIKLEKKVCFKKYDTPTLHIRNSGYFAIKQKRYIINKINDSKHILKLVV